MAVQDSTSSDTVAVRLTPQVAREVLRRPKLQALVSLQERAEGDAIRVGVPAFVSVPIHRVRELLEDAEAQRENGELSRGVRIAYGHFRKQLSEILEAVKRSRLIPFPGEEQAARAAAESAALFHLGDTAMVWEPGDAWHGALVEIVGGFGFYRVKDEHGPYFDGYGPLQYAKGYVVRYGDGGRAFHDAGSLRNPDCSVRHLQLAHDSGRRNVVEAAA